MFQMQAFTYFRKRIGWGSRDKSRPRKEDGEALGTELSQNACSPGKAPIAFYGAINIKNLEVN